MFDKNQLKVALCGYHWPGCQILEYLLSREDVSEIYVFTHKSGPDIPDLEKLANERGVFVTREDIGDSVTKYKPDIIASVYYRNIIKPHVIEVAVNKLKKADSTLDVEVGDITSLRYLDGSFRYVLAFGLYHNLEHGLDKAVLETNRVLEHNGMVCASFRADNIQTRLTDWLANRKNRHSEITAKDFHKMNLTRAEFVKLFKDSGFDIESVYPVENMPILYKFRMFRKLSHKEFNENMARSEGYRLSWFGQGLQNFLMKFFPNQFCNIYVLLARKL